MSTGSPGPTRQTALAANLSILDQISDAIVVIDQEERVLYWNPAAAALYGVSADDALGRPLGDSYGYRWTSPDDEARARSELARLGSWRGRNVHVLRTGEERLVESTVTVLRDGDGSAIGLLAVIRDHTERVRAERARDAAHRELLEAETRHRKHVEAQDAFDREVLALTARRLEAAQRAGRIGLFDWDVRADRVWWSAELYPLMGLEPGAIEPTSEAWLAALTDEDRKHSEEAMREAVESRREQLELEVRLRQPGGGTRWVRTNALISYDDAGQPARVLGAAVDIETLKQAAVAREAFLAVLSHELRSPLNAILGWIRILRLQPHDGTRLERALDVIERNAKTQERLVKDLLDVSGIITGKLQLQLAPTELGAVVTAACDVVRPAADAKGLQLVVEGDAGAMSLVADAERLQQVVWNLLSNAIRFTPRGGRVTVRTERAAGGFRLLVADTGAGIAGEHLRTIFEPFRQIDSSVARSQGGLGLGLAIVRHLVEAHGGTVEASSEGSGLGTTFTVDLPLGPGVAG